MDKDINNINPYIIHCGYLNKTNCPPVGTVYEKRCVRWFEIELILWGEGHIYTQGEKIPAKRGRIFFRKPGMVVLGVSPYYCYLVVFDMVFSKQRVLSYKNTNFLSDDRVYLDVHNSLNVNNNFNGLNFPNFIDIDEFEKYQENFMNLYNNYINNGRENQFFLKTNLTQILLEVYNELLSRRVMNSTSRSISLNYPLIMKVKDYINNNVSSRLSLNQLAKVANLSPNFLCKIFKDIVGETTVNYINRCKINKAKKMLLETNKSVNEIAYELGFENQTYFFTLFKKMEGLRPLEYRTRYAIGYLLYQD